MPLLCSLNFPRAQYLDIRTLTHELIVKYLNNISEEFWSVNGCTYNIVCFELKITSALHLALIIKNHSHTSLKYFHKNSRQSSTGNRYFIGFVLCY